MDSLIDDAKTIQDELVWLRHRLHREPEVGLELPRTQEKVLAALDGLPLEITLGASLSSVVAVLRGARPGPAILLRADMDALPITERSGVDYTATGPRMHACGHDLHTTMLVGAARLLAAKADRLAGDVVLMFQPGEEGYDGAGHMIAEGVLDAAGHRAVAAYAIHVASSGTPYGVFRSRPGPMLSGGDMVVVTVLGLGGHGSAPHRAKDPVVAACAMVSALQVMVTRTVDVFDPVVISVGTFHAGTAANIIPDVATFEATVRTFSQATRARVRDAVAATCHGIARAYGLEVEVDYREGYPVTVNDSGEADFLAGTVRDLHGEERFSQLPTPLTAAEDFSRVLDQVPGALVMLGACSSGTDPFSVADNHSPLAIFDDGVLADGAALYAGLALRRLERDR